MPSNFKTLFLYILIIEIKQSLASAKKANADTGVDLFQNEGAALFKVVSFDTPTGVTLAITFASKVKSNYEIDWNAVQQEHKKRVLTSVIEQCKDKLWCNAPTAPYNFVEVILQNLDESKKFVKIVNIEPLKNRGYDSSVIGKHGCDAYPCMNNGKCVLRPDSSLGYVCICSSEYSGDFCQSATSTNKSSSPFLTSGCIVVLVLLIALGYLIYLHFFKTRKCQRTEKGKTDRRPRSRATRKTSLEPEVSDYNDTDFPTQNDEQKNVRFQVEAVRYEFENPDLYNDDASSSENFVNLGEKNTYPDITKSIPNVSTDFTDDGNKHPEENNVRHCSHEEPNNAKTQPTSAPSVQAGIEDDSKYEYVDDCIPSSDSESTANRNVPPSSQSDSIKSTFLKDDDDFESIDSSSSPDNGWETPGPMPNEDLLDKKHYYLVSIDKLKSTKDEEFQKDDLPTQKEFIDEYSSKAASEVLDQFNHDCDSSSQSTDCYSCAEESTYCALNNISLQDNCDTLVYIPRRSTDNNPSQASAVQDDSKDNSRVKEQKLVFPRHTKSGAVVYRLCDPDAESKD